MNGFNFSDAKELWLNGSQVKEVHFGSTKLWPSGKASRILSWSTSAATIEVGSAITISATPSAGSGDGTISYSSSNPSVATVSGNLVTGVSVGSCTITATISEGEQYLSATTSFSTSVTMPDYSTKYLSFKAQQDSTFQLSNNSVDYSLDDGETWVTLPAATSTPTVASGSSIMWRGTLSPNNSNGIGTFSSTGNFEAQGNPISLLYGDNFAGQSSLSGKNYAFYRLFKNNTGLSGISNLSLPATTLSNYCYREMFYGCTSLTNTTELIADTMAKYAYNSMFYGCISLRQTPSVLPSTTLSENCYKEMFMGCSGITAGPIISATTLDTSCCQSMFEGCSGLTTAPALPALTMASDCYKSMFSGCLSLLATPTLAATTLASNCYKEMFMGCTSLSAVTQLPATTAYSACYYYMFKGCTSITAAPNLPATTLATDCYREMFYGCTNLATIPSILPATTMEDSCYRSMFRNCENIATAPELPATTLAASCYREMFKNCYSLNFIKCSATDISASNCTTDWVNDVAATGTFIKNPNMASWTTGNNGIPTGWLVTDNEYEIEYLTIVSKANNNTIGWKAASASLLKTISVSTDNGQTWTDKASSTSGTALATLNNGDKLLIKGNNTAYGTSSYYNYFTSTQNFDIEGNIMSLLYGDNFIGETSLSGKDYAFKYLFHYTKLVNAKNFILPATTLANYCYQWMFQGCTALITAPVLPATTLATQCYYHMFKGCTSLTTAPELPATTLANSCYSGMFAGCTELISTPVLSATTVNYSSYEEMFSGCTALTTAPSVLPATTLYSYCYRKMFRGCTSLSTAPELPATNLSASTEGYESMFANCTSLTTAPELPATTLADRCYMYMFRDCTALTTAPSVLPATTMTNNCYAYMFSGCTSLTTAPELPATTLTQSCYNNMFNGCVALTTAPELLIGTLVPSCYNQMFYGCTSLNYIKCLATDISASYCTNNWVYGVASTGTFVKRSNMTSWTTGVNGIPSGWAVIDYDANYLTFVSTSDNNTISWKASNSSIVKTISASTDNGHTWTAYTSATGGITIGTLNTGDKLLVKGTNSAYANSYYYNYFMSTDTYDLQGNIMSLVYGDDFIGRTVLRGNYTFGRLFGANTKLISAEHLVLPATKLKIYCYRSMFAGCKSLTTAPELPATTLVSSCYHSMFGACTSLTVAPELPATTLAVSGYTGMFEDCTSLTIAPELPATTLAYGCYQSMFKGCTSLTTAPELPATTLSERCYQGMFNGCTGLTTSPSVLPALSIPISGCFNMFSGCTNLTTAPVLSATTLANYSYKSMFEGCTSLTTAPELPATTLAEGCYQSMFSGCTGLITAPSVLPALSIPISGCSNMFEGCTNLTTAPELPATTLAPYCYEYMFNGCTSLTSAPSLPATTLAQYCYRDMFHGCTSLTTAPELPATTLESNCYANMFRGCTRLTTAPSTLPATTLAYGCYGNMFQSCTSLTTAPELPATTLTNYCYYEMFTYCRSLNHIKCLATNISASYCTYNWVNGVAASGTFVKHPDMSSWTTSPSGIPTGWTVVDNHDYVEIGGIKWATMNVGANSITDTGLYFQWGDTSGYTAAQVGSGSGKKAFNWADYKFNPSGDGSTLTKYNSTDGKTTLDLEDDAVTAAWGGNWRMPTTAELQALGAAVNTKWVTNYQGSGINGRLCTDKTDSSKTLFFPACGCARGGSVDYVGSSGHYWSSSLSSSSVYDAFRLEFISSYVYWGNLNNRCYGFPVRGVFGENS